MPHAIWSGSLSFGLVNIPINLYTATISETLDFDLLRKKDLSPIRYARVAKADGKEVAYNDIVKGYQYEKGDYIVLGEDDFRKADVKKTESIEITDFVIEDEIDSIYFEKPYYIEPARGAAKPYALLLESLKKSGKIGIAKFVMKNREHIGILKPHNNMLVLEQLRYESEIKPVDELEIPKESADDKAKIDMAIKLIDQMTGHFDPSDYKDTYNEELLEIIDEKVEKGKIKPRSEEPKMTDFKNIMTELKRSLRAAV